LKKRRRRGVEKVKVGFGKLSLCTILFEIVTTSISDSGFEEKKEL
jgi:hypothetical protein